ncbi:hypothetical protein Tco_1294428 [Tanacetum coccineum]
MYQRLARHPANVQTIPDPILCLVGLKSYWEHSLQQPTIFVGRKEMAYMNFMFAVDDEEMSFLLREPSYGFVSGSPSAPINNEPSLLEVEPLDNANLDQLVENTADSEGSPICEKMIIVASGSVSERMKNQRCRTKGSAKPLVKRLFDALDLNTVVDCHLMISIITPLAWRDHLDNQPEEDLFDLHDHCYARQAMVDNAINRRARGLLKIVEQLKGECECEAAMEDFDKNPAVIVLRQKIVSLLTKVEVVSKVVPYVAMKLVRSDEMHVLVGRLMSSAIFYGRYDALEEVLKMKEPFDLAKVKGYRPSYKKEHTKAVAAIFPFLSEVIADPSASVETLLSMKPNSLRRPTPTQTTAPAPSAPSQQVTPSFFPSPMYVPHLPKVWRPPCGGDLKQILAFNCFCASLESISAIENTLGMVWDCQHGIYTAGGE